jgi:nucleoside-diphosphate-sugar epimerase
VGKNVLVTGGAGYVGSALVLKMCKYHSVDVVDLCIFGMPFTFPVIQKDFRELSKADLSKYDVVVHLAALSNDPMAHFSPELNFDINASGAVRLAYLSKLAGVRRFIFSSSASLYQGITDAALATPNNKDIAPQEPYAISKLMAETGMLSIASRAFEVVVFRKGTIGGVSPRMRYDLVANTMFKAAKKSGIITVYTDRTGNSVSRPHLDLRDAVERYMNAVSARATGSGVANLASRNLNVMELAREISAQTGAIVKREVISDATRLRNYVMDLSESRRSIGGGRSIYETVVDLEENAPRDYNNPMYYNIGVWREWVEKSQSSAATDSLVAS